MKTEEIIKNAKVYFGKNRKALKKKLLSFSFTGSEYKTWQKDLRESTKQPKLITYCMFDEVIENIKNDKIEDIDWHWIGDISWEIKILLNRGVPTGLDWDKRLATKCGGTARILQVFVSDILPCYTFDVYYMTYNKKEKYYEFGPIKSLHDFEKKELKKVKDLLKKRNLTFLNRKVSLTKYEELYSDCNSEGNATLFDVLFCDTANYQIEYKRISEKSIVDSTGKKVYWKEYYKKNKSLIKRYEYRYFPSGNVLLTITDSKSCIIEVKVWRDINRKSHQEFKLDILKEAKKKKNN